MISASKEFKEKLKKGANLVNYADITLSDGTVLHLGPKDFMISGCNIEDKTTDGKFGVGFVIGKTLSIKLENQDERFSQYDFYKSIINLYVAMQLDNGTIEKIRKGVYYTIVPEAPGNIIEISAVDGMYQLDKDYSASTTAYPATLQTIISDACLDCGIPIGFTQFDNMNYVVNERPESGTYRQIVSYACQIAGYNAHIDNNGFMQLVWYNSALLEQYNYVGGNFKTYPHDTVIDGGDFTDYTTDTIISSGNFTDEMPEHIFRIKSLSVSTDDVQITGVRVVGSEEKTALFGEEGYIIEVNNPFANGKEQEVANYLGARMVGMVFRPFSAQILQNPLYEPFEVVRVSDRKGNVYNSIINSVSYKIGGYTQIACEAEDPVRNGSRYVSPAAQAVVEARRNTEKQLTTYDKAVQNMNQIAMNAMGYHTTYEEQPDGSRITYLHDKPLLKDSKTIYKQTIDGFFISTDGGKSYTAGFDSQGNAVVNILYAIGIVCDWIRGGTLTLGGTDNVNGVLQVLDTSGNVICKITKDGLISQAGNLNDTISGLGSRVTQTENNITAEINRAKSAENGLQADYMAKIQATAESLISEFTAQLQTWDTGDYAISYEGEGEPDISVYVGKYYLDTESGAIYEGIDGLDEYPDGEWINVANYSWDSEDNEYKLINYSQNYSVPSAIAPFELDEYGTVSSSGPTSSEGYENGDVWLEVTEYDSVAWFRFVIPDPSIIILKHWEIVDYATVMDLDEIASKISQTANEIKFTVKKGDVSSQISVEEGEINITGNRISIESQNFQLTNDGELTCTKATVSGTIKSTGTSGNTEVTNGGFYIYNNNNKVAGCFYGSTGGRLDIYTSPGNTSSLAFCASASKTDIYAAGLEVHQDLVVDNDLTVKGKASVNGNFTVSGTKNRIIQTTDYGTVMQYCYETASPIFGDVGLGRTGNDGVCYIYLDPVFVETVNTTIEYCVFLQKEGEGDIWVSKKELDYFIVCGTPNLAFSWEVKAKQTKYEYERLENYTTIKDANFMDYESLWNEMQETDYEKIWEVYLEDYKKSIEYEEELLWQT